MLEFHLIGDKILLEMGSDTGSGPLNRVSILYNSDLSAHKNIYSGRTGASLPPTPEAHDSENFTAFENNIRYDNKYTPDDGFISVMESSYCNTQGSFMSFNLYEFGSQYAYQLDDYFFLMHEDNGYTVYNCFYQEISRYESLPRFDQNECYLFDITINNGNLRKRKLSIPDDCIGDITLSSQEEINDFTICEIIYGDLVIDDSLDGIEDIENLGGLSNLKYVDGNMVIESCPNLESLVGLNEYLSILDSVIIMDNENLNQCISQFLCNHLASGGVSLIENNNEGCNSIDEVQMNCGELLCPDADVIINNCLAASEFRSNYPYCTELRQDLIIGRIATFDDYSSPSITFEELSTIRSVAGSVILRNFNIMGDSDLKIEYIGGSLENPYNDFSGGLDEISFSELREIGDSFNLQLEPANSDGNLSMPLLTKINHNFDIIGYSGTLSTASLDSIGGGLSIQRSSMEDLHFLENVSYLGGDVLIQDNELLTECSFGVICEAIGSDDQNIEISYNAENCNSVDEVNINCDVDEDLDGYGTLSDCNDNDPAINPAATEIPNNGIDEDCDGSDLTTSTTEIVESQLHIYPNPATEKLYFDNKITQSIEIQVYNLLGMKVIDFKIQEGVNEIDISQLRSGVYLLANTTQGIVQRIIVE